MDLKTFLENFDVIAEAPGGIPKLRSLILDLAVRGKLVSQNPEDEPAESVLTKQHELPTSYERRKKRVKPSDLKLSESLFLEIPASWAYLTIQELYDANILIDFADGNHGELYPRKTDFGDSGITFVTAGQVINGRVVWEKCSKLIKEKADQLNKGWAKAGDVLLTHNATVGRVALVESDVDDFLLGTSVTFYRLNHSVISPNYLFYVFCSILWQKQLEAVMEQTTRNQVSIQKQAFFKIPLPPLAEQKRIVEKVDELMGLCDRYEATKQTRDNLRQKLRESAIASLMNAETDEELDAAWAFVRDNWQNLSQCPEDVSGLREATLQLAIRGKLVSQNINDESVLGLLAKITAEKNNLIEAKKVRDASTLPFEDSAFPCEIPNTWAWERFGNVILDIEAGTSPQCESRQKDGDEWGVIKISAVSWNKFNPDENKALPANMEPRKEFEIKTGDFIMSRANTSQLVGKSVVVENLPPRLLLNDKTLRVLFPYCIEKRFFNLYNNSALARQYYAGGGTGTSDSMKNITREQIRNLPVPVPPLHEQKRIVAKVDELMKLCDQLEASLRQSQQRAESLAASAISHLTI